MNSHYKIDTVVVEPKFTPSKEEQELLLSSNDLSETPNVVTAQKSNLLSASLFSNINLDRDFLYQLPTYVFVTGVERSQAANDLLQVLLVGSSDIGARPEFYNNIIKPGYGIAQSATSVSREKYLINDREFIVFDAPEHFIRCSNLYLQNLPFTKNASIILYFGNPEEWLDPLLAVYISNPEFKVYAPLYSENRFQLNEVNFNGKLSERKIYTVSTTGEVHTILDDMLLILAEKVLQEKKQESHMPQLQKISLQENDLDKKSCCRIL